MGKKPNLKYRILKAFRRLLPIIASSIITTIMTISIFGFCILGSATTVGSASTSVYNSNIIYTINYEGSDCDEFLYAEKIVKEFMGKDYIKPNSVYFVSINSNLEVFGFQEKNCIYISDNLNKDECIKTMIHELLHNQNPKGFDISLESSSGNITIGHNFTEAVIEFITCRLLDCPNTKLAQLFADCVVDPEFFINHFKKNSEEEVWTEYFAEDDTEYELVFDNQTYKVKNYVFALNQFDKWMNGVDCNLF